MVSPCDRTVGASRVKDGTGIASFGLVNEAANFVPQSLIDHAVVQAFGAALFLFFGAVEDFDLAATIAPDDVIGLNRMNLHVLRMLGIR